MSCEAIVTFVPAGTLDYLQDETNLVPRATAITVGGLTGLLVAAIRRRGLFKRLLYTGVGLAGSSIVRGGGKFTVCWDTSQRTLTYVQHWADVCRSVHMTFVGKLK